MFSDRNGGFAFFPEIYVVDYFLEADQENYQPYLRFCQVLEYLASYTSHELIHAWPQKLFLGQSSPWNQYLQERYDSSGKQIAPENRRYHLAHMAMCSLTAPAQEKLGFEPGIEPRIIYIYSRLKEYGVEDPYGLIVRAGATMNSDELWQTYESVREKSNLSMDELISTNDPDPDFAYYTPEELEAFRAEYAPYLSLK